MSWYTEGSLSVGDPFPDGATAGDVRQLCGSQRQHRPVRRRGGCAAPSGAAAPDARMGRSECHRPCNGLVLHRGAADGASAKGGWHDPWCRAGGLRVWSEALPRFEPSTF